MSSSPCDQDFLNVCKNWSNISDMQLCLAQPSLYQRRFKLSICELNWLHDYLSRGSGKRADINKEQGLCGGLNQLEALVSRFGSGSSFRRCLLPTDLGRKTQHEAENGARWFGCFCAAVTRVLWNGRRRKGERWRSSEWLCELQIEFVSHYWLILWVIQAFLSLSSLEMCGKAVSFLLLQHPF